jgi:preprotein translocase subunit SecF
MSEQDNNEKTDFSNFYDKNYKYFILIPAILLILSIIFMTYFYIQNNDIIKRDVSLKGGTTITVEDNQVDIDLLKQELETKLEDFSVRSISDLRTKKQEAFVVQTTSSPNQTKNILEDYLRYDLDDDNSSIEFTGSSLSQNFYVQLILAILFAFTFMGAVVFYIFGSNKKIKILIIFLALLVPFIFFILKLISVNIAIILSLLILLLSIIFYFKYSIPSFAVVLSAFADIIMTIALVNFLGWKISAAGIVAFLMLIGYSVDTDIMLTSRVLKRKEEKLNSRIYDAFKTGMTMTLTSLIAVVVALIITASFSDVLQQIFSILTIGLSFDILNTWLTNATLLKWYVEKKEGRVHGEEK